MNVCYINGLIRNIMDQERTFDANKWGRSASEYLNIALNEYVDGFNSKANKKRALQCLNYAYENLYDAIQKVLLKTPRENRDESFDELYYGLPHNLFQYRQAKGQKLVDVYPCLKAVVESVNALFEVRDAMNTTEVIPPFKPESYEAKKTKEVERDIRAIMEKRKVQFVEGLSLAKQFDGLSVSVSSHWVVNQFGTQFIRNFYYLFGKFTALNVIIAVAQKHEEENKERRTK